VQLTIGLAFVLALVVTGYESYFAWRVIGAKNWIRVSGTVIQSPSAGHNTEGQSEATGSLRYTYAYGGIRYTGERTGLNSLGEAFPLAGIVDRSQLANYRPGETLTVYLDPAHPSDSVLDRSYPRSAKIALGVAVAILLTVSATPCVPWCRGKTAAGARE
jgi:hypothetical protein